MGRIMGEEHAVRNGEAQPPELYDINDIRVVFHVRRRPEALSKAHRSLVEWLRAPPYVDCHEV